jgi:hypothetical protein
MKSQDFPQRDAVGFLSVLIPGLVSNRLYTTVPLYHQITIDRYLKRIQSRLAHSLVYKDTQAPPLAALVAEALAKQHKPSQDKIQIGYSGNS